MIDISDNHSLRGYNGLGLDYRARHFAAVRSPVELAEAAAFARRQGLDTLVVGAGSNLLLTADYPGLVIHPAMPGIRVLKEAEGRIRVRVQAGENWHGLVATCQARGWYGLENLALIPGLTGAAAVQNIGAYGIELSDFLHRVRVFEPHSGESEDVPARDCGFAYRDSVFKSGARHGQIITAIELELTTEPTPNSDYPSLRRHLEERGLDPARARSEEVFQAVCTLRRAVLPDPARTPNLGSFFVNPLVDAEHCARLLRRWRDLSAHPMDDGRFKLAAAQLIEKAGWKGRSLGAVGVSSRHALVIVNLGGATGRDVCELADRIVADVADRFEVKLIMEPRCAP